MDKTGVVILAKEILNSSDNVFAIYVEKAKQLTLENFGNKRILFNPIYVSNVCDGDCLYCGYRKTNKPHKRITLTPQQTLQEANYLRARGIFNILFLAGDFCHDKYLGMLLNNISIVKENIKPKWIGVEIASLDSNAYTELLKHGVNSVILFQETYDKNRYKFLHPSGSKADYFYRLNTLHRAAMANIPEVGFGVLYGVGNWYSDTISMLEHALSLKDEFPNLNLRFSFPRLMKSEAQDENAITELIDEETLFKIIIAVRNCFPASSLVLTGRESFEFMYRVIDVVNVFGKEGTTVVGGYTFTKMGNEQFELHKELDSNIKSLDEFINKLRKYDFA